MRTLFIAAAMLLVVYLYADRFLFRGELASLFRHGWRELLGPLMRPLTRVFRVRTGPAATLESPPEAPVFDLKTFELVEKKEYLSCPEVTEGDTGQKTVSTAPASTIFTPPAEVPSPVPETTQWRAPIFPKNRPPKHSSPQQWDDDGFADDAVVESQIPEVAEPDVEARQIRHEVSQRLEGVEGTSTGVELELTDEEIYGVDNFDADTYQ